MSKVERLQEVLKVSPISEALDIAEASLNPGFRENVFSTIADIMALRDRCKSLPKYWNICGMEEFIRVIIPGRRKFHQELYYAALSSGFPNDALSWIRLALNEEKAVLEISEIVGALIRHGGPEHLSLAVVYESLRTEERGRKGDVRYSEERTNHS